MRTMQKTIVRKRDKEREEEEEEEEENFSQRRHAMHEIAVFICVCIHTCILIRTVRRFYIVVVKLFLCESHPFFFPFKSG